MDIQDLGYDMLASFLYGLVGIALMMVGFMLIDLLTPGKLGDLIVRHRRRDVGIVVASVMLAIGAIITSAILQSEGDLDRGLAETAGVGLVGIGLMGVAFTAVDKVTPGKLGDILTDEHEDPAVAYVVGAALLAVGVIIAAAIS